MKLALIKKYLANSSNRAMLNIKNYNTQWLPYLKRIGIDEKVKRFSEKNKLKSWENEILFFACYYFFELEHALFVSNIGNGMPGKKLRGIEGHFIDYDKQRNKLITLVDELLVRSPRIDGHLNTSYIDSIIIKVIQKDNTSKSLTINNYTLCNDISYSLMKLLNISLDGEPTLTEIKKPSKKSTSYIKKFMEGTYPFFMFLKSECNLNLSTDKEYILLIVEFLEAIGKAIRFDINNEFNIPEDYLKDCYKRLKTQWLYSHSK